MHCSYKILILKKCICYNIQALSRALLELRTEMTAAAEERIISATSQKEANLNVQQMVDRHTKELKVNVNTFINITKFLIITIRRGSTLICSNFDNE